MSLGNLKQYAEHGIYGSLKLYASRGIFADATAPPVFTGSDRRPKGVFFIVSQPTGVLKTSL
jgi:hypothetical protein